MRMPAKQRTCRAGTDDAQHARLHAHGTLGVFRGGGWSDDGEEQQRANSDTNAATCTPRSRATTIVSLPMYYLTVNR
jgi:hypothetical protein